MNTNTPVGSSVRTHSTVGSKNCSGTHVMTRYAHGSSLNSSYPEPDVAAYRNLRNELEMVAALPRAASGRDGVVRVLLRFFFMSLCLAICLCRHHSIL